MEWYYAVGEERKGPLNEEEFQRLVQQGVVTTKTLVWREGMADWQPYAGSAPPPVISKPPPANGVVCSGCRGIFPPGEVISLAGGFHCAACKPLALQRLREGAGTGGAAEEMRKEHLKHEASVKSVGILYYLGGVGLFLAGILFLAALGSRGGGEAAVIGAVLLVLGAGQLWVGAGVRRLKSWARIPVGILSGFGLLGFPMGTLINGYILYLVFSKKGQTVFSDEYRIVIEQTPHIKYRTSIVVWIFLGLVLVLIGIGIIAAVFSKR